MRMLSIAIAVDVEDLRFLLTMAAILLIGALGVAALAITPWRRLPQPDGLEDWRL